MSRAPLLASLLLTGLLLAMAPTLYAAEPLNTGRGDAMLARYFERETDKLAAACLADIHTADDWQTRRAIYRQELFEMLGMDPMPERTPLNAQITGKLEHPEFTVEKVYFQSRPGLYVTGNLYVPRNLKGPAPTVLYVCGHSRVVKNNISYGGKANYQHHGIWLARNGFVCLMIDTLQLGEIEGLHHGTHHLNLWWWLPRGYTPAGVEAWNCIRALDYLETRPEVDKSRLGVTGRSGGGAYSWWIAALDDRISAAVPVAGIVDLHHHVVEGVVEGHCDCMFMLNTYRWDYGQVASLVAPRALLLTNTDKDPIFPLEGVERVHQQVRGIYRLLGANDKFGLQISEGPHKDIPELQVAAFRWLNRFVKQDDTPIEHAAVKLFEPEQLKVFDKLPTDERNTTIHETFVAQETPRVPNSLNDWQQERDRWMQLLREKVFRGWPDDAGSVHVRPIFEAERDQLHFSAYDYNSQETVPLRLYLLRPAGDERSAYVAVNVLDDQGWSDFLATLRGGFAQLLTEEAGDRADASGYQTLQKIILANKIAVAFVAPRGVGPTAFDPTPKKQIQNRRRYYLLGQTLDGMQVWDVRRAVQALRTLPELRGVPMQLDGARQAAGLALYASLFEPDIQQLNLQQMSSTHREGPYFLNVMRWFDVPHATLMAAERSRVVLNQPADENWQYAQDTIAKLGSNTFRLEFKAQTAAGK
ncbi:MAG: acetylxylan esterase [Planctomycetes bacterium]|nr:acetylxylan esterase [Planctomycetota bacterium]